MRFRITTLAAAILLSLVATTTSAVSAASTIGDYKIKFTSGDGGVTRTTYNPYDHIPGIGHPVWASTNYNSTLDIAIDTTGCTISRQDLGASNSMRLFALLECPRTFAGTVNVTVTGTTIFEPATQGSASIAITVAPVEPEPQEPELPRAVVTLKKAAARVVKATVNEWGRKGPTVPGALVAVQKSAPGGKWLRVVKAKTNAKGVLRVKIPGKAKETVRAVILSAPKGYTHLSTPSPVIKIPRTR